MDDWLVISTYFCSALAVGTGVLEKHGTVTYCLKQKEQLSFRIYPI